MSNFRLYSGTVRCADHMDASSYQGTTGDPCLYCPTGVSLVKNHTRSPELFETVRHVRRIRKGLRPAYPLYGHTYSLRQNDLTTLWSAFAILANEGGTAYQSPIPGTIGTDGTVTPVNF